MEKTVKQKKVINHHWGLCDAKGQDFPVGVPIDGTPELIALAKSGKQRNGKVMVTFVEEAPTLDSAEIMMPFEGDVEIAQEHKQPAVKAPEKANG